MAKTFQSFIKKENQIRHLEHIEDQIINDGYLGAQDSLSLLKEISNKLSGDSEASVNISVKWDGSPSIVCGINPENNRFFISTKSFFNKTPVLCYNEHDIYEYFGQTKLSERLSFCFHELKKLNIKNIIQGDLLYIKEDLKILKINNEQVVAFKPNTITYTVPKNSDLGKKILEANLGIAFHTTYKGTKLSNLKQIISFNGITEMVLGNIFVVDSNYQNQSGTANLTLDETRQINSIISITEHLIKKINRKCFDDLTENKKLKAYIKQFNNSRIREGEFIKNPNDHVDLLISYLLDKMNQQVEELKTEKGKENKIQEMKYYISTVQNNRKSLEKIFESMQFIVKAKELLLNKLNSAKTLNTFIETPEGFKVTAPEGFIAVDTESGKVVKLIDRLEFSYHNFNNKSWS